MKRSASECFACIVNQVSVCGWFLFRSRNQTSLVVSMQNREDNDGRRENRNAPLIPVIVGFLL